MIDVEKERSKFLRRHPTVVGEHISRVDFKERGNFTVCLLFNGQLRGLGVAKRRPDDRHDFDVGCTIALHRAMWDAWAHEPI